MTGNALNQWIEEEEALKLRLAEAKRNGEGTAYVTSEMVKDQSGLAIMQGILCGRYIAPSIGQTLNAQPSGFKPHGWCSWRLVRNPAGFCNGLRRAYKNPKGTLVHNG
jgi:hypothetical protein